MTTSIFPNKMAYVLILPMGIAIYGMPLHKVGQYNEHEWEAPLYCHGSLLQSLQQFKCLVVEHHTLNLEL
jgi:hypothetical protein